MTPAQFATSQGRALKGAVEDITPGAAYEGIVSTPAELGVDAPDRVSVALFSDNTAVPTSAAPSTPTNENDPVSPNLESLSSGAVKYPPDILHSFPDDPPPAP